MKTTDARSLPAPAQEALRRRAVEAVRNGMTRIEAAPAFGVNRPTVGRGGGARGGGGRGGGGAGGCPRSPGRPAGRPGRRGRRFLGGLTWGCAPITRREPPMGAGG